MIELANSFASIATEFANASAAMTNLALRFRVAVVLPSSLALEAREPERMFYLAVPSDTYNTAVYRIRRRVDASSRLTSIAALVDRRVAVVDFERHGRERGAPKHRTLSSGAKAEELLHYFNYRARGLLGLAADEIGDERIRAMEVLVERCIEKCGFVRFRAG